MAKWIGHFKHAEPSIQIGAFQLYTVSNSEARRLQIPFGSWVVLWQHRGETTGAILPNERMASEFAQGGF